MLPKTYRLKNRNAFTATYKQKKCVSDDLLILYIGREKTEPSVKTKFGFVVSKKYHKRAVKRNRIKRLMREAVRLSIKESSLLNCEKYLSFVFLPKQACFDASFAQVRDSVKNLMNKVL